MRFEAMQLDTISVIDIDILLLCNSKMRLIVEEPARTRVSRDAKKTYGARDVRDIPARFLQMKLGVQCARLPIKSSSMAMFAYNRKMTRQQQSV